MSKDINTVGELIEALKFHPYHWDQPIKVAVAGVGVEYGIAEILPHEDRLLIVVPSMKEREEGTA